MKVGLSERESAPTEEGAEFRASKFIGDPQMKHSLVSRVRSLLLSDSEGGAIIEIAVTLPLVMLIMTGIFSFSLALYQKLQLAEAVSNAGHYLAVARGDHDPCANAVADVIAGAPGLTANSIVVTMSLNGTALPQSCPGTLATDPSSTFASAQGETVTVGATYVTSLGVYQSQYSTLTLASQISEIVQ
jgi:Flp pilus assembly protein TadG